ncbi:hypothetical protein HBI74_086920 [Parastagonospora nodorum]|nr:hypothetical protein HBI74_086920 [Parastagonospora nodorum]
MSSVIIFGPTGQVGSIAAHAAAEQGAKVWLAMRDTSKKIPSLAEDSGAFHRVQADLQKPETVLQAVQTSGARRAFIYLVHGAPDHMRAAIEALKAAGISFVVFLSSFTIPTKHELRAIPSAELIPHAHAQVEANLDDVFGPDGYVAVRPGCFVTNLLSDKAGLASGRVVLYGATFLQDNIAPADIGRVAGSILVSGPRNGQKKVYLYGPEILSIYDSTVRIGRVLGKELEITALGPEEGYKRYIGLGMPEHFAKYMVDVLGTKGRDKGDGEIFPHYEEGVRNVELYTGRPATSLEDWVRENKAIFSA